MSHQIECGEHNNRAPQPLHHQPAIYISEDAYHLSEVAGWMGLCVNVMSLFC